MPTMYYWRFARHEINLSAILSYPISKLSPYFNMALFLACSISRMSSGLLRSAMDHSVPEVWETATRTHIWSQDVNNHLGRDVTRQCLFPSLPFFDHLLLTLSVIVSHYCRRHNCALLTWQQYGFFSLCFTIIYFISIHDTLVPFLSCLCLSCAWLYCPFYSFHCVVICALHAFLLLYSMWH